jgi:hypothetical protein
MLVSSIKKQYFDYLQISIVLIVLEYFIFKSKSYISGIIILTIAYYIFNIIYYKISLLNEGIEIKYLFKTKYIDINRIHFIEIRRPYNSIYLTVGIKIKYTKTGFDFGYSDDLHLMQILNYFKEKNIKIIDKNERLNRIFYIENDRYIKR